MYWNVPTIGCDGSFARPRGEAEVEELGAGTRQHHVAGLQVAVHDPGAVRGVERLSDLRAEAQDLRQRQRSLREALRERLALDQLEHHVVQLVALDARAADVVDRTDVRVVQRRDALRLALEAGAELGVRRELRRQQLDGDLAVELRVARAVDLAHAAGAERSGHLVAAEARGHRETGWVAGAAHGCPPVLDRLLRR
jgi:hypothetical protein